MSNEVDLSKYTIDRQGKSVLLYAGLLALAHNKGLVSITTQLVQIPSEANKNVAICTARVTVEQDGCTKLFEGTGDAAPNNVAPAMQTCLIRMAETRAKARALRDAVNVAMEIDGDAPDEDAGGERPYSRRQTSTPRAQTNRAPGPRTRNETGAVCPGCNAPDGNLHGTHCTALAGARN